VTPVAPVAPVAPVGPVTPVAPVGPVIPPVGPVGLTGQIGQPGTGPPLQQHGNVLHLLQTLSIKFPKCIVSPPLSNSVFIERKGEIVSYLLGYAKYIEKQ